MEEININDDNAILLEFDCSNIKEVVEKIKNVKKVNWEIPKDNYRNILAKGKSKYKEMKQGMKRIRVIVRFTDMQNDNLFRQVGDELIVDDARADVLISHGYAKLVETIIEKKEPIEKAVKETKKEKAVKEKATKKVEPEKKATKKNAKK